MSYCVNCGVKLGEQEKRCPLCNTVVINPNEYEKEQEEIYPETIEKNIRRVDNRILIFISVCFVFAAAAAVMADYIINAAVTWSLVVGGSLLMPWLMFVLPVATRVRNIRRILAANLIFLAVYLVFIDVYAGYLGWSVYTAGSLVFLASVLFVSSLFRTAALIKSVIIEAAVALAVLFAVEQLLDAGEWFLNFALPIVILSAFLTLVIAVGRYYRFIKSYYTVSSAMIAAGFFSVGLELIVGFNTGAGGPVRLTWSLYAFAGLLVSAFIVFLIGRSRKFREYLKKNLHTK